MSQTKGDESVSERTEEGVMKSWSTSEWGQESGSGVAGQEEVLSSNGEPLIILI